MLRWAILGVGLFWYLGDEYVEGDLQSWNQAAFLGAQALALSHPWLVDLATAVTHTADWGGFLVAALALFSVIRDPREFRAQLLVLLGAPSLITFLKLVYHLPRPMPAPGFAFPSGHTLFATCVYGYLGMRMLLQGRRTGILLVLWPVAVGWSRIMLNRHWLGDVIGGLLMGSAWVSFCLHLRARDAGLATRVDSL